MSLLSCLDLTYMWLYIQMLAVIIFNLIYIYWYMNMHTSMLIGSTSCVLMPIIMNPGAFNFTYMLAYTYVSAWMLCFVACTCQHIMDVSMYNSIFTCLIFVHAHEYIFVSIVLGCFAYNASYVITNPIYVIKIFTTAFKRAIRFFYFQWSIRLNNLIYHIFRSII